jgi:hypothetical protein
VSDFDAVWRRIEAHAGEMFHTTTGLPFTYRVPGAFLRVTRDGREINRSLSRTNFEKAQALMPVPSPSALKDSQGSAYTFAILTDPRIRA